VQELIAAEEAEKAQKKHANVDVEDLLDDPDLEALHEQRIAQLKEEREKRQQMSHKGHGDLTDISEGEFLEVVTKTDRVVCHFYHKDFERCKIMNKHLKLLAPKYFKTRFCKMHGPDAPFFVAKLQVQMLPCVIMFVSGVAVDRVVGFDELGKRDDFDTKTLEARFITAEVVEKQEKQQEDDGDDEKCRNVRKGLADLARKQADSDEDSDF
jgi:thioredoxin-like negative regulator of GroEL